MSNRIHIVCLDAPAPPDYGGAIDMFYKIKALAEEGKKITLHYFNYNPSRNSEALENYCEAIYTYNRKSFFSSPPFFQPYIISSRINKDLIARLNTDDSPVLLEGLHCAGIVPYLKNKQRIVIRMHNEEASYYAHLAKNEKSVWKKAYFGQESRLLKNYQLKLDKDLKFACLSATDVAVFEKDYSFTNLHFIPCFIPWQTVSIKRGIGNYCLYHGNMSVSENNEAALWLINNIFTKTSIPFVIAGKGISSAIHAFQKSYPTISCVNNPSIDEIDTLVQNAHINVLPSMNATGVKLKLLNALLNGRFCITNSNGVMGSGLEKFVLTASNISSWTGLIESTMQKAFTAAAVEERKKVLSIYDNAANAAKLSALW